MITMTQACELYCQKYPDRQVASVLDVGDEWVVAGKDKESGMALDVSPVAIRKEDGAARIFFPPANRAKLKNAKIVFKG